MLLDKIPSSMGIYTIIHVESGKQYIGSSVNMRKRIVRHIYEMNNETHANRHLLSAWKKHGASAFECKVVELWGDSGTLCQRETELIAKFDSTNHSVGYNFCKSGRSALGLKRTQEVRQKMSLRMLGTKMHPNAKAALVAYHTGRKRTPEQLKKQSDSSRQYSESDVKFWVSEIQSGKTYAAISSELGVDTQTLQRWVKREIGPKWNRSEITQPMKDAFSSMYKNGLSANKIAEYFGCDKKVVMNSIREMATPEERKTRHLRYVRRTPKHIRDQMSELLSTGMSLRAVGRILGVGHPTVKRYTSGDNYDGLL